MVSPLRLSVGKKAYSRSQETSQSALGRAMQGDFRAIEQNFRKFADHMERVSPDILKEALEPTFEKAKNYTPKDTGDLVESAYLETRNFRGRAQVEMGFAKGGTPDYAIFVHEMLDYAHKAPTQAKFLERAIDEDANDIQRRVVELTKRAAGV